MFYGGGNLPPSTSKEMLFVMQTVILAMLRQAVAQRLISKICDMPGCAHVRALFESDYANATSATIAYGADAVVFEVAEFGEYDTSYCLKLCDRIRREAPACRLLLLCPEHNEQSVSTAGEAKLNGQIDDFLFHDASIEYMVSKLLAI